jgi:hypothetical protein
MGDCAAQARYSWGTSAATWSTVSSARLDLELRARDRCSGRVSEVKDGCYEKTLWKERGEVNGKCDKLLAVHPP